MSVRNALKIGGIVLAVIVMCSPLIFWPAGEAETSVLGQSQVTVTVPPVAVVPTTLSPAERATSSTTESAAGAASTTSTEPPVDITVAAVGDIIIHDSILQSARDPGTGTYNFWPIFDPVGPYLRMADYTVCNLETRLAGPDYGYSGDTVFNSPVSLTDALGAAGIDLAATANNHALDRGWAGIVATLDRLDEARIAHVGTYRSMKEKETPFIVEIKGIKVAFLNYTAYLNGLSPPAERADYAVNVLDADKVAAEAMIARMWGADVVIALLHYGSEYRQEPSEAQTEISEGSEDYEGLLSRGVDVILGSHSHTVQPIVHVLQYSAWMMNHTYVAYSLGNFLSAQSWRYSDSGVIAYVHIEKKDLRVYVTGISYLPVYVQHSTVQSPATYRILPVLPGVEPDTDVPVSAADRERMDQVWEELNGILYRPDENIVPLDPADIGIY
jgi:poly-gamma-glutamate capsule biosynthesis protein CapA/YwtB (metallophosphatase superfamily)